MRLSKRCLSRTLKCIELANGGWMGISTGTGEPITTALARQRSSRMMDAGCPCRRQSLKTLRLPTQV